MLTQNEDFSQKFTCFSTNSVLGREVIFGTPENPFQIIINEINIMNNTSSNLVGGVPISEKGNEGEAIKHVKVKKWKNSRNI